MPFCARVLFMVGCQILLLAATQVPLRADELEKKIGEIDDLRANLATPFDEVERRCLALLAEYPEPADQARIYYIWAHVEGQSGLQHPDKGIEYIKKAMSLPLDGEKRLQLHMYWGNSLEMVHRGVQGEELKKARPEIVIHYLNAINECVNLIADTNKSDLPSEIGDDRADESPDGGGKHRRENARKFAIALNEQKIERILAFQAAFETQTAYLYSRKPFATEEIQQLAEKHVTSTDARQKLISRVLGEIDKREAKASGDALKKKPDIGRTSQWTTVVLANMGVVAVIIGIALFRKKRQTS
jgi:hypothetical protein